MSQLKLFQEVRSNQIHVPLSRHESEGRLIRGRWRANSKATISAAVGNISMNSLSTLGKVPNKTHILFSWFTWYVYSWIIQRKKLLCVFP